MERRIEDIEYAQLMLNRYTVAQHRHYDGIDRSVYLLLSRIDNHGPMTIGDLSEAFRLDASTLQRQTSAALRAGFLERTLDSDGGVARKFTLTELGKEQFIAARDRSTTALKKILGDWTDADVNHLADALQRFNTSLEDYSSTEPLGGDRQPPA